MLSNLDFCLKVLKIVQDKQINCDELYSLINIQLELLEYNQLPQKLESFEENIVKQLDFYRNEGKNLNQIRQQLQLKYKKLKQAHQEQQQINDELKQLLRNQKQEINDLKQQIQQQQQQQQYQQQQQQQSQQQSQQQTPRPITMQTPKIYNKFQDTMIQMRKQDKSFQNCYMAPQLTIEIKNIRTPLLEKNEPHDLRELFQECVKQLYQENQIRKNPNIKQMRDTFFQRNYQGEMKLTENDQKMSLQKMDIKQLTSKFFLHPHFLKMVESQIFNLKCCTNMNCLYNFQKLEQQVEQAEEPQIFERTQVKAFRQLKNRSVSIGRSNDSRLQYQQLFAEVLRLEREISIMTGRNQRNRASELQNELKKANQELCQLQLKLLQ